MLIPTDKIKLGKDNLIYLDGCPAFKAFVDPASGESQTVVIQFCDRDRYRSTSRGTRLMEIRLGDLLIRIQEIVDEALTKNTASSG